MLLKLFALGILAALAALIAEFIILGVFFDPAIFYQEIDALPEAINNNLFEKIIIYVLIAPLIEEYFKYVVIKKIGFPSKYFNQIIDGVIYAVTAAMGFALFENFLYFFGYISKGIYPLMGLFVLRTFMSTLLHTLSTGCMGYWLGRAKFHVESRKKFIYFGFISAAAIHAVFNFFMVTGLLIFAVFTLIIISALFFKKIRGAESQMFWYPVLKKEAEKK